MKTLVSIPELTQNNQWQPATWEDYLGYVNNRHLDNINITFDQGSLWINIVNEGINHSNVNDLLSFLFYVWFSRESGVLANSFSGCVIEKPNQRAASPDKVLYIGENSPKWQEGEPRRINLEQWRVPDLVGEISDTTLAIDLDEKKQLYAALGIPEYWVIDIRGKRAIAFQLQENGKYQEINTSIALNGLPIALLELTLEQLEKTNNFNAAFWFSQQIVNLPNP